MDFRKPIKSVVERRLMWGCCNWLKNSLTSPNILLVRGVSGPPTFDTLPHLCFLYSSKALSHKYIARSSAAMGLHCVTAPSPNRTYEFPSRMDSYCPLTLLKKAVGRTMEKVMSL